MYTTPILERIAIDREVACCGAPDFPNCQQTPPPDPCAGGRIDIRGQNLLCIGDILNG